MFLDDHKIPYVLGLGSNEFYEFIYTDVMNKLAGEKNE